MVRQPQCGQEKFKINFTDNDTMKFTILLVYILSQAFVHIMLVWIPTLVQ